MKQVLRAPLKTAQRVEQGATAAVHFTASLADGTLLFNSRDDRPLEIRVGAQPSEAVRKTAIALLL